MNVQVKKYPQATPAHSSEHLSAQCDHWRRRTYWLAGVALTILAASASAVVFAINDARAARASLSQTAPPAINVQPPPLPETTLPIVSAPRSPQETRGSETAGPQARSLPEGTLPRSGWQLDWPPIFPASHCNIGLLADGVESEAYTAKEAGRRSSRSKT